MPKNVQSFRIQFHLITDRRNFLFRTAKTSREFICSFINFYCILNKLNIGKAKKKFLRILNSSIIIIIIAQESFLTEIFIRNSYIKAFKVFHNSSCPFDCGYKNNIMFTITCSIFDWQYGRNETEQFQLHRN